MLIVYGGTFNPPHLGHVLTVQALKAQGHVMVVPSAGHEFKPASRETYSVRKRMAEIAFGDDAWMIEDLIDIDDPRRGLLILRQAREIWPTGSEIVFAIGPDIDPSTWTGYDEIVAEGFGFLRVPESGIGVRSTNIRAMLRAGNYQQASLVMPGAVLDYVVRQIPATYWSNQA